MKIIVTFFMFIYSFNMIAQPRFDDNNNLNKIYKNVKSFTVTFKEYRIYPDSLKIPLEYKDTSAYYLIYTHDCNKVGRVKKMSYHYPNQFIPKEEYYKFNKNKLVSEMINLHGELYTFKYNDYNKIYLEKRYCLAEYPKKNKPINKYLAYETYYTYNDKQQLIETTVSRYNHKDKYEYNENGLLSKHQINYIKNGQLNKDEFYYTTFSYEMNDSLVAKITENTESYLSKGKLVMEYVFKKDDFGNNLIDKTYQIIDGKKTEYAKYEYNYRKIKQ